MLLIVYIFDTPENVITTTSTDCIIDTTVNNNLNLATLTTLGCAIGTYTTADCTISTGTANNTSLGWVPWYQPSEKEMTVDLEKNICKIYNSKENKYEEFEIEEIKTTKLENGEKKFEFELSKKITIEEFKKRQQKLTSNKKLIIEKVKKVKDKSYLNKDLSGLAHNTLNGLIGGTIIYANGNIRLGATTTVDWNGNVEIYNLTAGNLTI